MGIEIDPITGKEVWVSDEQAARRKRDAAALEAFNQVASPTTIKTPQTSQEILQARLPGFDISKFPSEEAAFKFSQGIVPSSQTETTAAGFTPTSVDGKQAAGYGAGAANAALDAAAKKYWANVTRYGQQRANAMRDFYAGLAGSTARTGADIARGGQGLAADIEALYERLGQQSQIQPGAAGTVAPQTAYGALTPISGAQATAAQQIPAAGASLADYLAGQQNAAAATFLGTSAAQAAQGQGAISDLVMNIQAARAQEEYNRAQQKIANLQRAASSTADIQAKAVAALYDAARQGLVSTDKKANELAKKQAALIESNAKSLGITAGEYIKNPGTRQLAIQILSPITPS